MRTRPTVLICDDEPDFGLLMLGAFELVNCDVVAVAATWVKAEDLAVSLQPDAILVDYWLQFPDGGAIGRLRAAAPDALVVLISALPLNQLRREPADVAAADLVLSKQAGVVVNAQRIAEALA
jgi:CheY-like chemotaxis protein